LIKTRSSNENRYFHGVVLELLSDFTGHTTEELKLYLKRKFGWIETKQVMGMTVEVPMSTADMNTADFEKFMGQIRMWASAELNCYVPEPNEVYEKDR
jgi:hypothetical protein